MFPQWAASVRYRVMGKGMSVCVRLFEVERKKAEGVKQARQAGL